MSSLWNVYARIHICVHSHFTQMDRALNLMMGLFRVLLSPHTSSASIMPPLLPQSASTCMLWSLSENRSQHLRLPRAAACRVQQFCPRKAAALHGAAALMTSFSLTLSLSLVLVVFLSHRNLHDCSSEQDKHTYNRTTQHQLQCSPV